jgi:hypothetical protein
LPGAVSLGAYEGGALAALLVAVQHLDGAVVIDSIASASAGSVTALLADRALARGADPIELMTKAWVDLDALSDMVTHDTAAPLSSQSLTVMAEKVLGANGVSDGPQDRRQVEPVRLSMVLASLSGLSYRLASLERDTPLDASTYVDWYRAEITGDTSPAGYLTHAEAAIASGSNAIGFPPKLLDRSADEATYLAAGILNFPRSGEYWYTDRGTIDNEPLGRTIDLAPPIEDDEQRLFVLLHADPAAASRSGIWQDTSEEPSWLRTAMRAVSISRSQSIYDDLKRLEKTNSRLRWKNFVMAALEQGLADGLNQAGLSDAQQSSVREALASTLQAATTGIENDRKLPKAVVAGSRSYRHASRPHRAQAETQLRHRTTARVWTTQLDRPRRSASRRARSRSWYRSPEPNDSIWKRPQVRSSDLFAHPPLHPGGESAPAVGDGDRFDDDLGTVGERYVVDEIGPRCFRDRVSHQPIGELRTALWPLRASDRALLARRLIGTRSAVRRRPGLVAPFCGNLCGSFHLVPHVAHRRFGEPNAACDIPV